MKQQKIRGHKRRHRHIEEWKLENLNLRFDLIEKYNGDHIDIVVHPWCDISIINSKIPEPKAKTKELMLIGLIDIYESWKKQLDELGQPYYLKIWLYEPRFSKSQVVCGVGEKIEYYKNVFSKPDENKKLKPNNYGKLKGKIESFNWNYYLDEDNYDNTEVGESEMYASRQEYEDTKKWFAKLLKKPHRTNKFKDSIGDLTESYSFKRGDIWVGGRD